MNEEETGKGATARQRGDPKMGQKGINLIWAEQIQIRCKKYLLIAKVDADSDIEVTGFVSLMRAVETSSEEIDNR